MEDWIPKYFVGIGTGIAVTVLLSEILPFNTIPSTKQVQEGFIAPSKLEVKCEDLDKNGRPETMVNIGEDTYLLREEDGEPVLTPYEVEGPRIKYKED